jgi:hypothetical protein
VEIAAAIRGNDRTLTGHQYLNAHQLSEVDALVHVLPDLLVPDDKED